MSRDTKRALIAAMCALSLGVSVVACGGDQNAPQTQQGKADPSSADLAKGSPDIKCNFATNVLMMIDASTNNTALPTTKLGVGCTDPKTFAAYKSLFP